MENEIQHRSIQEAFDHAIDLVLRGEENWVNLKNIKQETVKFTPRKSLTPPPPQRIGDSLRNQYVDLLDLAFAQGFITQQEREERASTALAATTRAQLEPLTRDLEGVEREKPAVQQHRHKTCVDLPIVVMLMVLVMFATALFVSLI